MNPDEIETWLWSARTKLIRKQNLESTWWPNTSKKGNDGVTPLGYLVFLEAATSRCSGKQLTVAAHAPEGSTEKLVIDTEWSRAGIRDVSPPRAT
jgi:hypothetical protein